MNKSRGYFGIGIQECKTYTNYGTLYRTANILGASFLFLIGKRFHAQQSDTMNSWKHIPTYSYDVFDDFLKNMPVNSRLIGIEMNESAKLLENFTHPERAVYLLGAEDFGLSQEAIDKCDSLICLRGIPSMNVSVAGSIVLYDRVVKLNRGVI